jgi:hydrogenase-4 transcriptional activator
LRERREDLPLLAQYFIQQASKRLGVKASRIPQAQIEALGRYDWPGNIRELQNVIERAVILSQRGPLRCDLPDVRRPKSLQMEASVSTAVVTSFSDLEAAGRELTISVLRECRGRIYGPHGAAVRLGIKPTTLLSRMKKMGVNRLEYVMG